MIYDYVLVGSGFSAYCVAALLKKRHKVCAISPATYQFVSKEHHRNVSLEFNRPFNSQYKSYMKSVWKIGANRLVDRLSLSGNSGLWGGTVNLEKDCSLFSQLEEVKIINMNQEMPGLHSNRNLGILTDKDGQLFNTAKFFIGFDKYVDGYVEKISETPLGILALEVSIGGMLAMIHAKKVVICTSLPQLVQLMISSQLVPKEFKFSLHEHTMTFKLHEKHEELDSCRVSYKPMVAFSRIFGLRAMRFPGFSLGPYLIDQTFTNKTEKMEYFVKDQIVTTADPISTFGKSIHYYGLSINDVPINTYLASVSRNILNVGHSSIFPNEPGPLTNYLLESASEVTRS